MMIVNQMVICLAAGATLKIKQFSFQDTGCQGFM